MVAEGLEVEGMYLEEEDFLLESEKRELGVSQVGSVELSETVESSLVHAVVGTEVLLEDESLDLVLEEAGSISWDSREEDLGIVKAERG